MITRSLFIIMCMDFLYRLKEYLGSGQFGIVYHGLLTVAEGDLEGGVKEVAVKTMENGASEEDRVKFLQEAAIMGQFNNPYIIKIYGILTSSQPVSHCVAWIYDYRYYHRVCRLCK